MIILLQGDGEGKNAYALSGIEWGAYRNTINNADKFVYPFSYQYLIFY